ncbi:MAG: hypothetical protein QOI44_470, partial [Actinomycetota bacterium]|nr:hypothetical protein [Actinomycetota bacterium]
LGQLDRVVGGGQGVEIDDAEHGVVVRGSFRPGLGLDIDPSADGAEVVAEMNFAGRFDAREHPCHDGEHYR